MAFPPFHQRNLLCPKKKINGKRKEHSLDTTDRKIADRRLKEWIANLEEIDSEAEKMTLAALLEKFTDANQGKALKLGKPMPQSLVSLRRHGSTDWASAFHRFAHRN